MQSSGDLIGELLQALRALVVGEWSGLVEYGEGDWHYCLYCSWDSFIDGETVQHKTACPILEGRRLLEWH